MAGCSTSEPERRDGAGRAGRVGLRAMEVCVLSEKSVWWLVEMQVRWELCENQGRHGGGTPRKWSLTTLQMALSSQRLNCIV